MNRFFSAKGMALVLILAIVSLLAVACAGDDGARGGDGATGAQGPQGAQGLEGPQGDKGDKGDKGFVGPTGPKGANGGAGDNGDKGDSGERGASGAPGVPGQPGPAGATDWSNIDLSAMTVTADAAVNITAYLSGWGDGESVTVELNFSDGTTVAWGTAIAGAGGTVSLSLTHDGLAAGVYGVEATGDKGGKDSAALVSAAK